MSDQVIGAPQTACKDVRPSPWVDATARELSQQRIWNREALMRGCCSAILFGSSEHCRGRARVLKLEGGSCSCQQDRTMADTMQGVFLWAWFCTHVPLRPSKQTCLVCRASRGAWMGPCPTWRLSGARAVPAPGSGDTSNSRRILPVTFWALQSSPAYRVPKSRSLPTECIADTSFVHVSAALPLLVSRAL